MCWPIVQKCEIITLITNCQLVSLEKLVHASFWPTWSNVFIVHVFKSTYCIGFFRKHFHWYRKVTDMLILKELWCHIKKIKQTNLQALLSYFWWVRSMVKLLDDQPIIWTSYQKHEPKSDREFRVNLELKIIVKAQSCSPMLKENTILTWSGLNATPKPPMWLIC